MDKQKIFTNATYEYMNEVMDLKELAKYHNLDSAKLLYGYDIIMQLSLMEMISIDKNITDVEIEFLDNIVYENDLMKILSDKLNKELSWDILKKIDEYDSFLEATKKLFYNEITSFISLFMSIDFTTSEDYLNRFKGNIYYICQAILEVDGFDTSEKAAYKILNNGLFRILDDIKSLDKNPNLEIKKK